MNDEPSFADGMTLAPRNRARVLGTSASMRDATGMRAWLFPPRRDSHWFCFEHNQMHSRLLIEGGVTQFALSKQGAKTTMLALQTFRQGRRSEA